MPDFDRLAQFKLKTNDGEAVWVAIELEKAWLYGCPAAMPPTKPKPLKKGTGKIAAADKA